MTNFYNLIIMVVDSWLVTTLLSVKTVWTACLNISLANFLQQILALSAGQVAGQGKARRFKAGAATFKQVDWISSRFLFGFLPENFLISPILRGISSWLAREGGLKRAGQRLNRRLGWKNKQPAPITAWNTWCTHSLSCKPESCF